MQLSYNSRNKAVQLSCIAALGIKLFVQLSCIALGIKWFVVQQLLAQKLSEGI